MKIITDESYKNLKRAKDFYGEINIQLWYKHPYSMSSSKIYMQHVSAETTELSKGDVQSCADWYCNICKSYTRRLHIVL